MDWDAVDFVIFAAMLAGVGVAATVAARKAPNTTYLIAVGVALAATFLLLWINGAVGIIGSENNVANMLYIGVIAVALLGAFVARFEPQGMARAMLAASIAQVLIAVTALVARLGYTDPSWPWDIVFLTVIFAALWATSAWLFDKAAQEHNGEIAELDV